MINSQMFSLPISSLPHSFLRQFDEGFGVIRRRSSLKHALFTKKEKSAKSHLYVDLFGRLKYVGKVFHLKILSDLLNRKIKGNGFG
jgi:hypothetical protein